MDASIGWGILGTGNVAHRFARSLSGVSDARLVACASRSAEHARAFAAEFGCEAQGFEELLANPQVDVVYVALPHLQHAEWSLAAIEAGKSVLCEKPAAISCAQALTVVGAAEEAGVLFVEAMKPRFQPLWERLVALAGTDALGALTSVDASLSMRYPDEPNPKFDDPVAGGVLLDLGTYCASWLDAFTAGDPENVSAQREFRRLVDVEDAVELTLGGVACRLHVSALAEESLARLTFERGTLEAWPLHRPTHLRFAMGERTDELEVPLEGDDFSGEIAHMHALLRAHATESPLMPHAATVRCARILDACASGFDRLGVAIAMGRIMGEQAIYLNEPMADHTSFEVGGPADVFVEANSILRLREAMNELAEMGVPVQVIGNGTDLLVSDAGLRACVFSTEPLQTTRVDKSWIPDFGVARLYSDAGVDLARLSELACEEGLGGLEFACGIPGSVGGAIYMNAGAYDGCIADVLESCMVRFPDGRMEVIKRKDLALGYRTSRVKEEGLTVLTATFLLPPKDRAAIRARMDELTELRESKQPLDVPSAGSTFKRPEGRYAGQLISEAGLKGRTLGGAQVSPKHAGFIVNANGATASELHDLIQLVIEEVRENSGVTLEPEVQILGRF